VSFQTGVTPPWGLRGFRDSVAIAPPQPHTMEGGNCHNRPGAVPVSVVNMFWLRPLHTTEARRSRGCGRSVVQSGFLPMPWRASVGSVSLWQACSCYVDCTPRRHGGHGGCGPQRSSEQFPSDALACLRGVRVSAASVFLLRQLHTTEARSHGGGGRSVLQSSFLLIPWRKVSTLKLMRRPDEMSIRRM
jgi:hypothetical protein